MYYTIVARSQAPEIEPDQELQRLDHFSHDADAWTEFYKFAKAHAGEYRQLDLVKHIEFYEDGHAVIDDYILDTRTTKPARN